MLLVKFPVAASAYAVSQVAKDPDKMAFVLYLILTGIGAAIISLIITGIAKFALDLDKEQSQNLFTAATVIQVIIAIIAYFVID